MSDNTSFTIVVGGMILFAFGILGSVIYTTHIEKMECIKQRGTYANGTCVDLAHPPKESP